MEPNIGVCKTCLSRVTPTYDVEPDPGITYGFPTKEDYDDPDFQWGGCQVFMPDNYFCESCNRKLEFSDMILPRL
jgi:hypothetical protein